MTKVLIAEDDMILAKMITRKITDTLKFEVTHVTTLAQAMAVIEQGVEDYFIAILDLYLPDAPDGEIIDMVAQHLPVVVFTAQMDDDVRSFVESKPVIDYVIKHGERSIKLLVELVQRLSKNQNIKAMVVDDSAIARTMLANILKSYQFQVLTAGDGDEALALLAEHPDIRIVITDYIMPNINGLELLETIRGNLDLDRKELAIIGVSGQVGDTFSAKFIKNGGNDFLIKPFLKEELICRINQNIEFLEHIEAITTMAERDHLSGLYNRRYFFEVGERFYANARRDHLTLVLAMLDIDHFKSVNDVYGHYAGDQVIKAVANTLNDSFRSSDLVARIGGEEFCVLATNMDPGHIRITMERLRQAVENTVVTVGESDIRVTISIGVHSDLEESLAAMLNRADELLYKAKTSGRNRVEEG